MNIFPSDHRFMVTITYITGDIDTGTISASSVVTIYSAMTMYPPTIYSTSTMDTGIGVLESRTVR